MHQQNAPTADTDASIIQRVLGGDVQAYGTLVERYERGLLGAILPVVRDLHAAQDVAQDVFVQAYLKLPTLRDRSRFAFWLHKIARREALRALRCQQQARKAMPHVADAALHHDPELFSDEKQRLLEGVRQLPAHERLIVGLRYFDGHSVRAIANLTNRPIGTITKQLSRALARLRNKLGVEPNHV
jgi:RNA polymerase sigma-70 factor (ECF subfamily)